MAFTLNAKDNTKLQGANPALIAIVNKAVEYCPIQFHVGEGLRTVEQQRAMVAKGVSQTMNSRHIGGFAVDLWAYPMGVLSWDLKQYEPIAEAMRHAALDLQTPLQWGCAWERYLADYDSACDARLDYVQECRDLFEAGKRSKPTPFFDAPHFQLPAKEFPNK